MAEGYTQLTLKDRKEIEEGLDRGDSFRRIASLIGRSPSTVSREVRENRSSRGGSAKRTECRDAGRCELARICPDCPEPGTRCASCPARDCRDSCPSYSARTACSSMSRAPWVCNGCRKERYGCGRAGRWVYRASAADRAAAERRSESRSGIDMSREDAEAAMAGIRDGLSRGLSPYEISQLSAEEVGVSPSTIYRWVEAGYGGLSNIDLERKVGFKPRSKSPAKKASSHSPKRRYDRFEELPGDLRASATEMDTVVGRAVDRQCALTLFFPAASLQLWLLTTHDSAGTAAALTAFRDACPPALFAKLMRVVKTDNGEEFADEDGIAAIIGEDLSKGVSLYYCDPRHSEQKPRCEKNHTEGRQLLRKGMFVFDELDEQDLRVVMCHTNSNPRLALGGLSPIGLFLAIYGEDGAALLDALGVEQVAPGELTLLPDILDAERAKRGKEPLTRLR